MEKECIFCNIVNGKTDTRFVFEDDQLVVFKDINPHAPVHDLIVPRRHIRSINDMTDADQGLSLIHISEPTRLDLASRMPSSA